MTEPTDHVVIQQDNLSSHKLNTLTDYEIINSHPRDLTREQLERYIDILNAIERVDPLRDRQIQKKFTKYDKSCFYKINPTIKTIRIKNNRDEFKNKFRFIFIGRGKTPYDHDIGDNYYDKFLFILTFYDKVYGNEYTVTEFIDIINDMVTECEKFYPYVRELLTIDMEYFILFLRLVIDSKATNYFVECLTGKKPTMYRNHRMIYNPRFSNSYGIIINISHDCFNYLKQADFLYFHMVMCGGMRDEYSNKKNQLHEALNKELTPSEYLTTITEVINTNFSFIKNSGIVLLARLIYNDEFANHVEFLLESTKDNH